VFAYRDDLVALLQPDGAAAVAFEEPLGVAVRVHVDLDPFLAIAVWAMHGFSPFFVEVVVTTIYRRQSEGATAFFAKKPRKTTVYTPQTV
jgi:hypothetical protein